MITNFPNFKIFTAPKINVQNAIKSTPYLSFRGSSQNEDTFEKSIKTNNIGNISKIEEPFNKDRIERLYGEVYEDIMELIPVAKELNIQKPKPRFAHNTNMGQRMCYTFEANSIVFNMNKIDGDYYFCTLNNKDGTIRALCGIHNEKQIERDAKQVQQQYPDCTFKTTKLTDKEKEGFLKATIAHELRHCIQCHLEASTKDVSRMHKALIMKIFEQVGGDYSDIEYLDNFVPKKIITEDAKLKYSMNPDDNRYLSTREHIFNYTKALAYNPNNKGLYYASPLEADANNFAYEYFNTLKEKSEDSDIRPFMGDNIGKYLSLDADTILASMEKYGFRKLIKK